MKYKVIDEKYLTLIQNIKKYFTSATDTIWDKRNKINIVTFQKEPLLVKSFKIPHLINKVAYSFFRDSKAKRSYTHSLRILKYVPKPIGYVEVYRFGLLYESYFVSQKYVYDFTIREVLNSDNFPNKNEILKQLANFTYTLHQDNIEHIDYSLGNILIKKIDEKYYEFKIVDVNRMHFKELNIEERLANFSRLFVKSEDFDKLIIHYASFAGIDKVEALEIANRIALQQHKKRVLKQKFLKFPIAKFSS